MDEAQIRRADGRTTPCRGCTSPRYHASSCARLPAYGRKRGASSEGRGGTELTRQVWPEADDSPRWRRSGLDPHATRLSGWTSRVRVSAASSGYCRIPPSFSSRSSRLEGRRVLQRSLPGLCCPGHGCLQGRGRAGGPADQEGPVRPDEHDAGRLPAVSRGAPTERQRPPAGGPSPVAADLRDMKTALRDSGSGRRSFPAAPPPIPIPATLPRLPPARPHSRRQHVRRGGESDAPNLDVDARIPRRRQRPSTPSGEPIRYKFDRTVDKGIGWPRAGLGPGFSART